MNIDEMSENVKRNICMDCGTLIDLKAHEWYRKRNPDGIPRRCSLCAFDTMMDLIEQVKSSNCTRDHNEH